MRPIGHGRTRGFTGSDPRFSVNDEIRFGDGRDMLFPILHIRPNR
jgi:hypothetical protein